MINGKFIKLALLYPALCASTFAAAFTPGDLAIYRVGDGSTALAATTQAVFIDEYTASGTLVQSIAVPSSGASQLTTGNSSIDGELSLSTNGQYLAFVGYDLATGGTIGSTTNRVVGRLDITTGVCRHHHPSYDCQYLFRIDRRDPGCHHPGRFAILVIGV